MKCCKTVCSHPAKRQMPSSCLPLYADFGRERNGPCSLRCRWGEETMALPIAAIEWIYFMMFTCIAPSHAPSSLLFSETCFLKMLCPLQVHPSSSVARNPLPKLGLHHFLPLLLISKKQEETNWTLHFLTKQQGRLSSVLCCGTEASLGRSFSPQLLHVVSCIDATYQGANLLDLAWLHPHSLGIGSSWAGRRKRELWCGLCF